VRFAAPPSAPPRGPPPPPQAKCLSGVCEGEDIGDCVKKYNNHSVEDTNLYVVNICLRVFFFFALYKKFIFMCNFTNTYIMFCVLILCRKLYIYISISSGKWWS